MKTIMEIGEFLANPLIAGILFAVLVLPVFWGLVRVVGWMKESLND